ncbi:Protein argonaute 2, partial [Bienertia sinuspersici]
NNGKEDPDVLEVVTKAEVVGEVVLVAEEVVLMEEEVVSTEEEEVITADEVVLMAEEEELISNFSINSNSKQQQQQGQQPFRQGNQWASSGTMGVGHSGPNRRPASSIVGEGSSGGQQQSTGDNYAAKLRQSSQSTPDRGLVAKIPSLNLSGDTSQSKVPITRPNYGGLAIRYVNILVNHFPVHFNPESTIRHYDIDVKPDMGPTESRPVKVSKANLSLIMERLLLDNPEFPEEMIAFDGEKNIFSAVPLPTGIFTVNLSPGEDGRCKTYKFSVTIVELKLHDLKDYLTGNLLRLPRDVLQGMDVVMKENPRKYMVSIGKGFHTIDRGLPLKYGLEMSEGFRHSLKPTSQGLALCLDYSVLAVRKRLPVLQYLEEHIGLTVINSDSFHRKRRDIEGALKGLKVTVTHRRTKQKYIISGLTERNARDISFTVEDPDGVQPSKSLRLLDYFRDKYPKVHIEHRDIPCLSLGKGKRSNYVPMELCVLVEGQRFPKDNLDRDSAVLLKNMSLASPVVRRDKICGMLQHEHGPARGKTNSKFGIDVTMNMTRVKGRVIEPPKLKLRSPSSGVSAITVDKDSCQWNLVNKLVVEGKSLVRWAVLDLSSSETPPNRLDSDFISKLVARCNKLGLHMESPLFTKSASMQALQTVESVNHLLANVHSQALNECRYIKWVSETKIGVLTQCCLSKMASKGQDQYLANLGMKINAKLGGSNVELFNQVPLFDKDAEQVMLIGADVNHPRPSDLSSPSIAAVVASMNWPAASKYVPRISPQNHCVEEIKGFGHICLQLVKSYEKLNGTKPQKLVIFRDGVSEGQFDMVLNSELWDLLKAMEAENYRPTITLIVARKRHQTRLFPETPRDGGRNGNIPPGTVVDTTIVHPWEFDFYLCSHNGSIGTSKPTHYHVLWDEHGFTSDKLQKFIYDLCFTFARCCKPISLAPPVYYADLLAYRGRLHYDAQSTGQSSSGISSSSSATSSSSTFATFSEIVLHTDIENAMYFI